MAQITLAKYNYVSDNTNTYKVRIDNISAGAQTTTAVPASGATNPTILFHTSNRKSGIKPRHLVLYRTAGTAPNIKTYYTRLIILIPGDVVAMRAEATFNLNGTVWTTGRYVGETLS